MSNNRVLVLMAGGYTKSEVPKHLLSFGGAYLFERIIDALPIDSVWVSFNQYLKGFWVDWYNTNVVQPVTTVNKPHFKNKYASLFIDKQNPNGEITNPALWMTSSAPSLAFNYHFGEIVFSGIDTFFQNFDFVEDFMKEDSAIVVGRAPVYEGAYTDTTSYVELTWRGKLKTFGVVGPTPWIFADMVKVKTDTLLKYGQLQMGDMASVVEGLMRRGTAFKAIKVDEGFMDCGRAESLYEAEKLYGISLL